MREHTLYLITRNSVLAVAWMLVFNHAYLFTTT